MNIETMTINEKILIACNINTNLDTLLELANEKNDKIIRTLLYRPFLEQKVITIISKNKYESARKALAIHYYTPIYILEYLSMDNSIHVLSSLAKNFHTPQHILSKLFESNIDIINKSLAQNINTPIRILKILKTFENCRTINKMIRNSFISEDLNNAINQYSECNKNDKVITYSLWHSKKKSKYEQVTIKEVTELCFKDKLFIAHSLFTKKEILEELFKDDNDYIRTAAYKNLFYNRCEIEILSSGHILIK